MARKKLPSPDRLPVERVVYMDPSHGERMVLDLEILTNTCVGYVGHEDDKQVVLIHEMVADEDWRTRPLDYTQIPKVLIVHREVLGVVNVYGGGEDGDRVRNAGKDDSRLTEEAQGAAS